MSILTTFTVQTGGNQACPIFGSAPLKSTHGNLLLTVPITRNDGDDDDTEERISYHPSSSSSSSFPSMVTVMTPGSPFCPWVIQAKQGQKVNLTLFTFHQFVQTTPDVNNQVGLVSVSLSWKIGSRRNHHHHHHHRRRRHHHHGNNCFCDSVICCQNYSSAIITNIVGAFIFGNFLVMKRSIFITPKHWR